MILQKTNTKKGMNYKMNKTDINLITEAYTQVNEMGLKKKMVSDMPVDDYGYEDSALQTQAENALQAFLNNVDEGDELRRGPSNPFVGQRAIPLTKLPKEVKLKVIETWINKLKDYHRMVKTESSPTRSWED